MLRACIAECLYFLTLKKNYLPPGVAEMVSGIGSAIGISFPSPGVLIVLKLNSIEVDPQIIEILQSYVPNTYNTSNEKKFNVFVYEKITIPVYHLHMKKLIHHLDIALYSQLNSRLVFLHLLLLTISVKNILSFLNIYLPNFMKVANSSKNLRILMLLYLPLIGCHSRFDN